MAEEENIQEGQSQVEEDDDSLPFPRARIVNIMRQDIPEGKQIRSEVKEAMNLWLGNLLKNLSKNMGNTQYGSVGISDFQRATKPFDMIEDIVKDEERLVAGLEKIKLDAESLQRELDRFFTTITGEQRPKPQPQQ